eukprot:SAG22_NODE_259_length_13477_cov_10.020407_11_plen_189_part_00
MQCAGGRQDAARQPRTARRSPSASFRPQPPAGAAEPSCSDDGAFVDEDGSRAPSGPQTTVKPPTKYSADGQAALLAACPRSNEVNFTCTMADESDVECCHRRARQARCLDYPAGSEWHRPALHFPWGTWPGRVRSIQNNTDGGRRLVTPPRLWSGSKRRRETEDGRLVSGQGPRTRRAALRGELPQRQ